MGSVRKVKEKADSFSFPSFDEKLFFAREIIDSKMLLVSIGYGLLIGVLAAGLTHASGGALLGPAAVIGIALGVGLHPLFRYLHLPEGRRWLAEENTPRDFVAVEITRNKWLALGAGYVATMLVVHIMLVNPPLADFAAPELVPTTAALQELGGPIFVTARISDNERIDTATVVWYAQGELPAGPADLERRPDGTYARRIPITVPTNVTYEITVEDTAGHTSGASGEIHVVAYAAPVVSASFTDGQRVTVRDTLSVSITDNVRVAYSWYAWDVNTSTPWFTLDSTKEHSLRPDRGDPVHHTVTVPRLAVGKHVLAVCATDGVPGSRTCRDWTLDIV